MVSRAGRIVLVNAHVERLFGRGAAVVAGVWLALIGFVINGSARGAALQTRVSGRLGGMRVADVMDREPVAIIGNSLVYRVGAGCRDDQDFAGDRLEIGPEMDRTLQGQDLLRRRLNAEMREHRLVGSLLLTAGYYNPRTADPE